MSLLDDQRKALLNGTAYTNPLQMPGTLQVVQKTYEDRTLDYLMQQLALTNRRIIALEGSLALAWALLNEEL